MIGIYKRHRALALCACVIASYSTGSTRSIAGGGAVKDHIQAPNGADCDSSRCTGLVVSPRRVRAIRIVYEPGKRYFGQILQDYVLPLESAAKPKPAERRPTVGASLTLSNAPRLHGP